jgi:hypothetical protein
VDKIEFEGREYVLKKHFDNLYTTTTELRRTEMLWITRHSKLETKLKYIYVAAAVLFTLAVMFACAQMVQS